MTKTVKGVIYAPEAPTCGDRVLDYFVVSEDFDQSWAIVATCVIGDATSGPHSPVRLIVKANTRTVMVRQLKVPVGFTEVAPLPYVITKGAEALSFVTVTPLAMSFPTSCCGKVLSKLVALHDTRWGTACRRTRPVARVVVKTTTATTTRGHLLSWARITTAS